MQAKLLIKHDYITLTVKHEGLRANLTTSYRGEKVSASGPWNGETFKTVANAFLKASKDNKGSYGDLMEAIRVKADAATNFNDFASKLVA